MSKLKKVKTLDALDMRILRFIHAMNYHPTREDMERFFFHEPLYGNQKRYFQERLHWLTAMGYIKFHNTPTITKPFFTRTYYLLKKGYTAIGEMPQRSKYKEQKLSVSGPRKALMELLIAAEKAGFTLVSDDATARAIMVDHIALAEQVTHQVKPQEAFIANLVMPSASIPPEFVLRTHRQVYICAILNPLAEAGYVKRLIGDKVKGRKGKYERCLSYFQFLILCTKESQYKEVIRFFRGTCGYVDAYDTSFPKFQTMQQLLANRFLVLKLTQIDNFFFIANEYL